MPAMPTASCMFPLLLFLQYQATLLTKQGGMSSGSLYLSFALLLPMECWLSLSLTPTLLWSVCSLIFNTNHAKFEIRVGVYDQPTCLMVSSTIAITIDLDIQHFKLPTIENLKNINLTKKTLI